MDQEATTWTTSDLKFKYFTLVGGRPDGRWAVPNARMKNFKFYNHTRLYGALSLTFDGFNKYTFKNADTGSTYKFKYLSNTYDLGTVSNVYIKDAGTYSENQRCDELCVGG